jgi:catalase (peroxidase I)
MDYEQVKRAVKDIMTKPGWDDGSLGPVLVRLAWHASGTYELKTRTGGSNGATMRFAPESTDGANAGLQHARLDSMCEKASQSALTLPQKSLSGACEAEVPVDFIR